MAAVIGIEGVGRATCAFAAELSLEELVYAASEAALDDAGVTRREIDGVCLAGSDQLDGRSISSMPLAGPAGGYLRDEIKVGDDGSLALATAVMRLQAGASRRVLAVSWTKSSESPPQAALAVNADPTYGRPVGLTALASEALVTTAFVHASGISTTAVDAIAQRCRTGACGSRDVVAWPLRACHIPPPTDAAVALVLSMEPSAVAVAGLAWGADDADPGTRRAGPDGRLSALTRTALREAGVPRIDASVPVETTDRTVFRLCMSVAGLGLAEPRHSAQALLAGDLPRVNETGGLWASNPLFAAGLECVARAASRVRDGAELAVAHSCYGAGGQGQLVTVLRAGGGRDA